MSLIHLTLLHKDGSNSPISSDTGVDDIPFYPYFFVKDLFAFFCFMFFFCFFVFYFPNVLNHPDNCIPADPYETPSHVVPEWYFLPYYAILRAIPHKAGGIFAMGGSLMVFFLIPFIYTSEIRNTTYRPVFKLFYWVLVSDFILLIWLGQKPMEKTYIFATQVATVYYFLFFFIAIVFIGKLETKLATYSN